MIGRRILITALAVVAGCATSHQGSGTGTSSMASQDSSARGTVHVVGAAPRMSVILDADGQQLVLTGPLVSELASLDGAEVSVHGLVGASPAPLRNDTRAITVRDYEIISIAGGKPVVGILTADNSGARVDSVPLAAIPPALEPFVGSKVWVVGTRTDAGTLRVDAFGVLRRAPGSSEP